MTVIAFVLDRRSCVRASQQAIRYIIDVLDKMQSFSPNSDIKYILVTQDTQHPILATIETPRNHLIDRLMSVYDDSTCACDLGPILGALFEYLHLYRMHQKMDTIGEGRFVSRFGATYIFVMTPGGTLPDGQLHIPGLRVPGCEYYREPFRGDQRFITFLWKENGRVDVNVMDVEKEQGNVEYWLLKLAETMKGFLFSLTQGQIVATVDALFGAERKDSSAVEFSDTIPPIIPSGQVVRLIHAGTGDVEFSLIFPTPQEPGCDIEWPIPEPYWLDHTLTSIPPLPTSQLELFYVNDHEFHSAMPAPYFYNRFRLDPSSSISAQLLALPRGTQFPCFVSNSGSPTKGDKPFGFLTAADDGIVYLYVLPYDFPLLFHLLSESSNAAPTLRWFTRFETEYISNLPCYYNKCLRQSLSKGIALPAHLLHDDTSPTLSSHLSLVSSSASTEFLNLSHFLNSVPRSSVTFENVFDVPRKHLVRVYQRTIPTHTIRREFPCLIASSELWHEINDTERLVADGVLSFHSTL